MDQAREAGGRPDQLRAKMSSASPPAQPKATNWALYGLLLDRPGSHLVTTAIEHPAIIQAAAYLETARGAGEPGGGGRPGPGGPGRYPGGLRRRSGAHLGDAGQQRDRSPAAGGRDRGLGPGSGASRCTPTRPRPWARCRWTWPPWGWICSPSPDTSSTRPRASARSTCARAWPWSPCCAAGARSTACAQAPRTCPTWRVWARPAPWPPRTWRPRWPANGELGQRFRAGPGRGCRCPGSCTRLGPPRLPGTMAVGFSGLSAM